MLQKVDVHASPTFKNQYKLMALRFIFGNIFFSQGKYLWKCKYCWKFRFFFENIDILKLNIFWRNEAFFQPPCFSYFRKSIIAARTKAYDYLLKSSSQSLDNKFFFAFWMAFVKNWSESAQSNTKADLSKFLKKSYWNLSGAMIRATAKCHSRAENQEF